MYLPPESDSDNKLSILLAPSGRCGSNWLIRLLGTHPKVHTKTEVWRQQLPWSNLFHPVTSVNTYTGNNHVKSSMGKLWWENFFLWVNNSSSIKIIKEVNLFLQTAWVKEMLPANTKWIILNRDIRGCISSFKRRDLYRRWEYERVYQSLRHLIHTTKKLDDYYCPLLTEIEQRTEVQKLTFMYCLGVNEIGRAFPSRDFHYVSYSKLLNHTHEVMESIYDFLGLVMSHEVHDFIIYSKSKLAAAGDHSIIKQKEAEEWHYILDKNELHEIYSIIIKAERLLPHLRSIVQSTEFSFDSCSNTSEYRNLNLTSVSVENVVSVEKCPFTISQNRRQIINEIESKLVKIHKSSRELYISSVLVTNTQYMSFIYWLQKRGFNNILQGYFVLINTEMPVNAGGRINHNDYGIYYIAKGFENHPVNWLTYIGAVLFARWVNCRLLTPEEYSLLKDEVESVPNWTENSGWLNSDTTPVQALSCSKNGIYDVRGNVYTWTQPQSSRERYCSPLRGVKGGAWNKRPASLMQEHYRNLWFTSRAIGVRVCRDSELDCYSLSDREFLRLVSHIWRVLHDANIETPERNCMIEDILRRKASHEK